MGSYYYEELFARSLFTVLMICFAIIVLEIIIMWKLFTKMGVEGWKAIIPFYNFYILFDRIMGNGLYMLVIFLPCIPKIGGLLTFLACVIFNVRMARSFGKEPIFALGLQFLPTIFEAILAFGSATYEPLGTFDIRRPFD